MEQYEKGFQRFHAGEDVRPVTSCKFLLASETPHAAKTARSVSETLLLLLWQLRINIDSFVVLVSGKFPCFLEIDILFILNYKSGTKLAKIYSTGNAMFIPTYNKKTNALVKNLRHRSNMSRRECDLTCLEKIQFQNSPCAAW